MKLIEYFICCAFICAFSVFDVISAETNLRNMLKETECVKAWKILWNEAKNGESITYFKLGLLYLYAPLSSDSEVYNVVDPSISDPTVLEVKEVLKWLKLSAEQDNIYAQICYAWYTIFVPKYCKVNEINEPLAFEFALKAANSGNVFAQRLVGILLEIGKGCDKDKEESKKWFKKAYETALKSADAVASQYEIGEMFFTGKGVNKSYKEAFKWYVKGAQQKHVRSIYVIGEMYFKGEGVKKNKKRAIELLKIASNAGFANATSMIYKEVDFEETMSKIYYDRYYSQHSYFPIDIPVYEEFSVQKEDEQKLESIMKEIEIELAK